ncbi:AbrB/MazE/SpoVT family DNA-binding domain-containing protein [Aerophototrophica crusticola]|uniref:AbrB/MazE/SpoVT family DNA-binding domain-containing protein n=1 Tax=Aerophototrophica crusticola TaxID=1709002 RepID=A0A858R5E6_9PROT|nr:AbrB/MazE/SpoVT family DNA-binding domain-containing protein [Rhodospirillaceae bacterium B3]
MSTTIKVNDQGEAVLPEDVLKQLGVKPGDVVEVEVLPEGRAIVRRSLPDQPVGKKRNIQELFGILGPPPIKRPPPTIEEINEAIAKGWAGEP